MRLVYNYYELLFDRILEDNKQKSIPKKDIESLVIEICKFQADLTPPIMSSLFVTMEKKYDLKNFQALESLSKRKVKLGTGTIFYKGRFIRTIFSKL